MFTATTTHTRYHSAQSLRFWAGKLHELSPMDIPCAEFVVRHRKAVRYTHPKGSRYAS